MSEVKRSQWGSNTTFILAAIGSAVGLGNAWRFPGLAAKHGGGAFLLVYLVAMLLMGIPLLMMEIAIGRKMRAGAPGSMKGLNKKFEPIGWAATSNAFVISTYYAVVFAWVIMMAIFSFKFIGLTGNNEVASGIWADLIKTTGTTTGITTISLPVIACLFIAWILIYMCIKNGTSSVGKVISYLIVIPIICLIIMSIKGLTMPNAIEGIKAFFIPDFSALFDAEIWVDAVGQVFYSMSVMMAIMFAYGSFLDDSSKIARDGLIIAFSDLAVSLMSGIVMFTTMYGTGIEDKLTQTGPGLAFQIYPTAIVNLSKSGVFNSIFSFIFYFCLGTLAVDSAFSIIEGVSTAVSDKFGFNKKKTTLAICVICGIISLVFVSGAGLAFLDIVDNWCNSFTLILIGVLETVAIGWFYKTHVVVDEINRNVTSGFKMPKLWFDVTVKVIAPVALSILFIWNIYNLFAKNGGLYEGYPLWANLVLGWAPFVLCMVSGFIIPIFSRKKAKVKEENE